MMIDMLFDILRGIWAIVGSLVGLNAIMVLVLCIAAMIKGAFK